jgi:hypothetical protein
MLKRPLAYGVRGRGSCLLESPVRWNHTSYHACHIRPHTNPGAIHLGTVSGIGHRQRLGERDQTRRRKLQKRFNFP